MNILIIIITAIMFATAIMMGLTIYGLFTDKDKDGIPDALEAKFEDLKKDIASQIKKIKK
jgi:hypothetical protein